jgi:hypothetical protein
VAPSRNRQCVAEGFPSLDLTLAGKDQLEHELRHFDGIDNKAGIVLGFAGVLVAVADGFLLIAGSMFLSGGSS